MSTRVRRNVWSLSSTDETLLWYRRAVEAMIPRPADQPDSWLYLAFIHGVPAGQATPPMANGFWDQCQHQSWYFLPWHRGYLASFEATVAKTIEDLGGPADWALPYWDYSEDRTLNPNARLMPPDFRDQQMPDGQPNFLWSRRAQATDGDFGIGDGDVSLAALRFPNFTNNTPGVPSGFGGPETGFNPGGGDNGGLERIPHNIIHGRIGGQSGFMSSTTTAALDPIFWLHHCNIDRLWDVWLNRNPDHANPDQAAWLTGQIFNMRDADGNAITFTCADMLDTREVMHGYRYDNVPVAAEEDTGGLEMMVAAAPAELAGASETGLDISDDTSRHRVALQPELTASALESVGPAAARRYYLNLENVTGSGQPGDYLVLVDLPEDDRAPLPVGVLTTFGLDRASDPAREHGGNGLTHVFDITDAAVELGVTQASVTELQVTFERQAPAATAEGAPPGLESFVQDAPEAHQVTVGRISFFVE